MKSPHKHNTYERQRKLCALDFLRMEDWLEIAGDLSLPFWVVGLERAKQKAAMRKRPYRGKHGIQTEIGFVPSHESPLHYSKQVAQARGEIARVYRKMNRGTP